MLVSQPTRLRLVRGDRALIEPPADSLPLPLDLDQVFRRYAPYVVRIASRMLGAGDEVNDLVQDVFLAAHEGLASVRDPSLVRHWLATITVRKARRRLSRRRWARFVGLGAPAEPPVAPDASPEQRAYFVAVWRVLDSLTPDARIAWVMHRVEEESLERIAEVCGCSRATAHRRITEAQHALERGLRDVPTP